MKKKASVLSLLLGIISLFTSCTIYDPDFGTATKPIDHGISEYRTPLQEQYLLDDYLNIHSYVFGAEELSKPNGLVLDFSVDVSKEAQKYTIEYSDSPYFTHSLIVEDLSLPQFEYNNPMLGETVYFRGSETKEGLSSASIHKITTSSVAPRLLSIDGGFNFRDLGGYRSSLKKGATVRQNVFFRGGRPDLLTDEGKWELYDHLGVRSEIDLRDSVLCVGPYIDGVQYYPVSIPSGTEETRFEEFSWEYSLIFSYISEASVGNAVYLHCYAGADRTGIVSFMLLTLLGVSYEDSARDYLMTNFTDQGKRSLETEFNNWYEKLNLFDGDTKAEQAKNWLISKGVSPWTIEAIRYNMLEGY